MKWKDFWDCPEEIMVWGLLQMPLYFIVGWNILYIMPLCGLLGRLGGVSGGFKWARWAVVPLIVCLATYVSCGKLWIFLSAPFMVKLMPFSYGKSGWLYKWLRNDFLVRMICMGWYWLTFVLAYSIPRI